MMLFIRFSKTPSVGLKRCLGVCRVCYPVPVMSLQASEFHSSVYGPWEYFPPPSPCPTVPFLTS